MPVLRYPHCTLYIGEKAAEIAYGPDWRRGISRDPIGEPPKHQCRVCDYFGTLYQGPAPSLEPICCSCYFWSQYELFDLAHHGSTL